MVSSLKRSVLYSHPTAKPSERSVKPNRRSNFVMPRSSGMGSTRNPGSSGTMAPTWPTEKRTWKIGLKLRSRSGFIATTSFSKGKS